MEVEYTQEKEIGKTGNATNNIKNICSITAKDLTNEDNFDNTEVMNSKRKLRACPYIYINVQDDLYIMLVDSGAEISLISVLYDEEISKKTGQLPTLPLTGLSIYNAIGNQKTKAERQVLIPLRIDSQIIHTPFIVMPHLNEGGIIGNDFLETHKVILNYEERIMIMNIGEEKDWKIQFIDESNWSPANLSAVQSKIIKIPEQPTMPPSTPPPPLMPSTPPPPPPTWPQPADWCLVTGKSLYLYIPTPGREPT